jgi:hypothetical protein
MAKNKNKNNNNYDKICLTGRGWDGISPPCPDRLWCPPILLSNEYRGFFSGDKAARGVKLTTHLQLVPRSRKHGSIYPFSHMSSWRNVQLVKHRDKFIVNWDSICICTGSELHRNVCREGNAAYWGTPGSRVRLNIADEWRPVFRTLFPRAAIEIRLIRSGG